jgi:hypothetical protein
MGLQELCTCFKQISNTGIFRSTNCVLIRRLSKSSIRNHDPGVGLLVAVGGEVLVLEGLGARVGEVV